MGSSAGEVAGWLGFFLIFFSGHPDCHHFSRLGIHPALLLWVSSSRSSSYGSHDCCSRYLLTSVAYCLTIIAHVCC